MTSYATSIVRFDYDGQLVLFNNNGWINATEAARNFGKRPNDWFGLSSTAEYIEALERRLGITRKSGNGLVEVWRGGKSPGTWLHPKLAVAFARWLSMDFAVWCDMQIDAVIHGPQDGWQHLRDAAAIGYQGMCDALSLTREAQGKQSSRHHFMNESRLINSILFGEPTERDRDTMTPSDLRLVAMTEQRNIFLLGQGMSFQERKQALAEYVEHHLRPRLSWRGEKCG